MSNRKSPFATIVGIFLILVTCLFVFSDFELIRSLFSSASSSIPQLVVFVVINYGIYAILSIAAFVSIKHKAAMFGLTLFLGVYTIYNLVLIATNPGTYFSFSTPQRIAALLGYVLVDVCFTLSVVHLAVFKAFRGNNAQVAVNPQPQYQEQQYQEQYQQQYQPQPQQPQQQNNNQNQGFQGYNNNNNDVGSF